MERRKVLWRWSRGLGRPVLRGAERVLGPAVLARVLWPGAAVLAAARIRAGPSELDGLSGRRRLHAETAATLTGVAWVFRDRFGSRRWRRRLTLANWGPVERTLAAGRPLVVATAHTEAMRLLARILCSRGIDAAMLVEDPERHSARFSRRGDARFATRLIGIDRLRAAAEFLDGPRALVVPIDPIRGRMIEARATGGSLSAMFGTGAARLGRRGGAACVSAVVLGDGLFRYRVLFGEVFLPSEPERDTEALGREILDAIVGRPQCWSGVLRGAVREATLCASGGAATEREGGGGCQSAA